MEKNLTPKQLMNLAIKGKAVVMPTGGRTAAAFICSMPFNVVMRYLQRGMKEYKSTKK